MWGVELDEITTVNQHSAVYLALQQINRNRETSNPAQGIRYLTIVFSHSLEEVR